MRPSSSKWKCLLHDENVTQSIVLVQLLSCQIIPCIHTPPHFSNPFCSESLRLPYISRSTRTSNRFFKVNYSTARLKACKKCVRNSISLGEIRLFQWKWWNRNRKLCGAAVLMCNVWRESLSKAWPKQGVHVIVLVVQQGWVDVKGCIGPRNTLF